MRRLAVLAALAALWAGPAPACVLLPHPDDWQEPAMTVTADCGFENAGTGFGNFDAGPARDIGAGRYGMVFLSFEGCDLEKELVVVDCDSGASIGLENLDPGQDFMPASDAVRRLVFVTPGPKLGPQSSVPALAGAADLLGVPFRLGLAEAFAELPESERPDLACGCRLHYPASRVALDASVLRDSR